MLESLRKNLSSTLEVITRPVQSIRPNTITLLGLLTSLLAAYFYLQATSPYVLIGALTLILSGYFDVADGFVAKKKNSVTKFGGLLDSVTDRYSDAAIVIALVLGGLADIVPGVVALVGFLLVSYIRARAESLGVKMATVGIADRAERLLILIGASLIGLIVSPSLALNLAVILLAILTHVTVLQRLLYARSRLK